MPLFTRKKGLFESSRVLFLPVDAIIPNPNQPRSQFEETGLRELASSIREHGILQPLTVRRVSGCYELVSGERRLRAARLCNLDSVPCILVEVDSEASSLLALVENLQRRDLDFLEEARALDKLIHTFHLSQEEAAKRIGKSQPAVANKLRLLKLSPVCLEAIRFSGLTERHARALLRLPEDARQDAITHIVEHGLNVAQTEEYVESLLTPLSPSPKASRRPKPVYIIKDVRLFLNTVTRGLSMMKTAGVAARYKQEETAEGLRLTIEIPR